MVRSIFCIAWSPLVYSNFFVIKKFYFKLTFKTPADFPVNLDSNDFAPFCFILIELIKLNHALKNVMIKVLI